MKKTIIALGVAFAPMFAFAYADAFTILYTIGLFIQRAIPILVAAAIMFLIFNIIVYVVSGDAEKKEQAKGYLVMTFIAIAFFAMLWGLVRVLSNTFGIQTGTDVQVTGQNDFIPIVY